jgi:hypothetical protein
LFCFFDTLKLQTTWLWLLSGTRIGNLKRHLKRFHSIEYEEVLKKEAENSEKSKGAGALPSAASKQRSIKQFYQSEKVAVTMTTASFKDALVKMVVKEGIAIRFFTSDAFKLMNGEMAEKLGVSLSAESIKRYVMVTAKTLKEKIKQQLEGKMVYVKLDCCTRIQTNYLGVNVRFVDPDTNTPVTRTLSVSDTLSRHSSFELKTILKGILDDFGIPMANILCIVTDNASNMVKMVREMNLELAATTSVSDPDQVSDSEESDTEDSAWESPITSCDREGDLYNILPTISHIRCAAHTLQLAIADGLKSSHASSLIGRLRYRTLYLFKMRTVHILFFSISVVGSAQ